MCEKQDVLCVNKEKVNVPSQRTKRTETDGSLQRERECGEITKHTHTHRQTQITWGYSFIPIPTTSDKPKVSLLIRRTLVA